MSSRLSRAVAAFAVAGLLAACSGGSEPEVGASSTVAPAADPTPSGTPSPTPSPTPTERDILADPENDVPDPAEALVAIFEFRDALFTAPDPDKLSLAYDEECDCYPPLYEGMKSFADEGQYAEFTGERRIEVEDVERSGPAATVRFRMDVPGIRLLGPDGEVVEEGEPQPEMVLHQATIVLRAGRWEMVSFAEVQE